MDLKELLKKREEASKYREEKSDLFSILYMLYEICQYIKLQK